MKKLIYILTFTLLVGCSDSNKTEVIEKYPDGFPKSVKVYVDSKDISNYLIKDYYRDGTLEFEGKVSNDKFVEYKKAYFENSNPKEVVELSKSADLDYCCPDGFYKYYYEHGQLKETHYKKDGRFNGLVTKYDSLGNKIAEYQVENNLKNGTTKVYYENGNIYSVRQYQNDSLIGKVYYFDKNGDSLKVYATFKGKEDFPTKKWLENGQIFYATYIDSTYDKVQYLWTDSKGNEIKRINLEWGQESEFISENGWVTPN